MKRHLIYHSNVPTNEDVSVIAADGQTYQCSLESISKDGLNLKCDRATLDGLLPNTLDIAPKQTVELNVAFCLSNQSQKQDGASAKSEVISIRRLSRDGFQLCLRFKEISEKAFGQVENYVDSARQFRAQVA